MAHYHYDAVCDACKESCEIMVNDPRRTYHFHGTIEQSTLIKRWMVRHYGCELRLIHRDDQIDKVIETYWHAQSGWNETSEEKAWRLRKEGTGSPRQSELEKKS